MIRTVLGPLLALAGATAAVWSPFRIWYDGRHGRDYRLGDLFSAGGITDATPGLFASLFLPFVVAALITAAGLLLRSRTLLAVAAVVVLAFTILWMVREAQAEGELVITTNGTGLDVGVANALGGGALLLLSALVSRGRRASRAQQAPEPAWTGQHPADGPTGEPWHEPAYPPRPPEFEPGADLGPDPAPWPEPGPGPGPGPGRPDYRP
ncbi:hypothetical protein [Streptomyces beihaiensis]|uniref:Uncharacterized protein n=1 Tax=Streptomyces beihaiensis TaxID=2984495 RepID=A0ABT3TWA3_9ACTN|nr:hypothetical protein [Streptomyces beihaiensis]MCX3061323.1 hypothetical protein [Streptomyces beihaiensis]